MFYAFHEGKKYAFYPLSSVIYGDVLDKRPLKELPDKIHGKIMVGVVGFNPVWLYKTVRKVNVFLN